MPEQPDPDAAPGPAATTAAELDRLAADAATVRLSRDGTLRELLADRGDGTADDEHDPEGTPLSAEWSRLAGVRAEGMREEEAIAAARARLASGTYGVCLACGRPVAPARLAARPTAELCIDCARRAESR